MLQRTIRLAYLYLIDTSVLEATPIATATQPLLAKGLATAIHVQQLADGKVLEFHSRAAQWSAVNGAYNEAAPLSQAVISSPWIQSPAREKLSIDIASAEAARNVEVDPPINLEQLVELIEDHGVEVASQAALWITHFSTEPADAFDLLDRLLGKGVRVEGELGSEVATYSKTLDNSQLLEFLGPELDRTLSEEPRTDLLMAAGFRRLPPQLVAERLEELFERAGNNEQRGRILNLWVVHGVEDVAVRQQLFRSVLYPMTELNVGALELVLRKPALLATAPNRSEVRRKLEAAADKAGKRPAAENAMSKAGLKKRRRKPSDLLGVEPKYDDVD